MVISKYKSFGGIPFNKFTKLFDSLVWSTINYGAAVWGNHQYSCINSVQNRAERFFMGVGRYSPNTAVNGDTAWTPCYVKQWITVSSHWCRIQNMSENRLNSKINSWSEHMGSRQCKNWNYKARELLSAANVVPPNLEVNKKLVNTGVKRFLFDKFVNEWHKDLNREQAARGNGRNKLRTYRIFKKEYKCEPYLKCSMSRQHRSAYAKFRCGVAPLRIETGRYENIHLNNRVCFNCQTEIEDERHALINCPLYSDFRDAVFEKCQLSNNQFLDMDDYEKLTFILNCNQVHLLRSCAKFCHNILVKRRQYLYK